MIKVIFVLVAVLALNVSAGDNEKKMDCIKKKFSESLENFPSCYDSGKQTKVPRMKTCYQNEMIEAGVVLKAEDGQMTVSFEKFRDYAQENKNNVVGKAMEECHKENKEDSDMYKESPRASQCVFEKVKKTCK